MEISTDRTLFDGRLAKHKRLDILWLEFHKGYFSNNFSSCILALNLVMVESGAYINNDVKKEFIKRIDTLQQKISVLSNGKVNPNSVNNYSIGKELRDIAEQITDASKKLYLPVEELGTGFDEEQFLRESG